MSVIPALITSVDVRLFNDEPRSLIDTFDDFSHTSSIHMSRLFVLQCTKSQERDLVTVS